MKKVVIITITAVLILTGVTTAVLLQKSPEKPSTYATAQNVVSKPLNADTIFELVNQEREKAGLQPLVRDARLDATAQARADDMVARNYFGHNDPVTGESLVKIKPVVTDCVDASENIISVDEIGEKNTDALNWWMHSESHKNAILNADYDSTGIAVNGNIGVQHFCTQ